MRERRYRATLGMGWASMTSVLFLLTVCIIPSARTEGRTPWVICLAITVEEHVQLISVTYEQLFSLQQKLKHTSSAKEHVPLTHTHLCNDLLDITCITKWWTVVRVQFLSNLCRTLCFFLPAANSNFRCS